jgi:diketogulonate reductase-like aldo/keto reductase
MEKLMIPKKQLKNGFSLPILSMGTWMIGGDVTKDSSCDEDAAVTSLQRGIEAGLTCIDTAEMYAEGYTEELLGRAIRPYSRQDLQLISKVSPQNLHYDDVLYALEKSLKRLGTDYLDVYLIHKYNRTIDLAETMRGLRRLQKEKLIRHIGVSNFSIPTLQKAQDLLGSPIVLNQVHYNLIYREPELCGLLNYCRENNIFLMAWRPLEKGLLTKNCPPVLEKIAGKYKKTPAQIAINWLISQKKCCYPFHHENREKFKRQSWRPGLGACIS